MEQQEDDNKSSLRSEEDISADNMFDDSSVLVMQKKERAAGPATNQIQIHQLDDSLMDLNEDEGGEDKLENEVEASQ